ncbi:MAG: hypothetical protein II878_03460 [Bacteroidales bacterium]|nr:hypothetical protein [Bacteroidales bacterium]
MTKKTKKLAILLVALMTSGSMFFASCNDDESLTNKEISIQNKLSNPMPDGWYTGYVSFGEGNVLDVKEFIKNGKVVEMYVGGQKKNVETTNYTHFHGSMYKTDKISWDEANKIAKEKAIDYAAEMYKEGWPCVYVIEMGKDLNGSPSHTYQVVSSDEPCDD